MSVVVPATLDPGRGQARAWAEQELLGREYQADRPGLVTRLRRWLQDHLPSFSGHWTNTGIAAVILAVLLVAVVAYVLWRAGGVRRQARAAAPELFGEVERTAADHRRAADAAEAAGDLATALLERFRALIRALADRDLVPLGPGLTADEAARTAGTALPDLAGALDEAARSFDDARYGDRPVTREQVRHLRDLDERAAVARPLAAAR